MNNFNYFFTPVGPEYKKTFARNVGIAFLILFALYGAWSLINDIQEPEIFSDDSNIDELIETFKEKYSEHGLEEDLDSKGIPYRYTATTNYNSHVELLIEKDRVILRQIGTIDGDAICIVSNPFPRDILRTCPSIW